MDHERLAIDWFDGKQVPHSLEEIEAFADPGIYDDGESDDDGNTNESD